MFSKSQHFFSYQFQYFVPDPILGYKINPKEKIYTSTKKFQKNIVYNVTYHINKQGFRVTPKFNSHQDCIWLVGDSFIFGASL